MFLKTLEIQGFKSFADKVTFSFSPGVTAIVGPNGSGKSNVVDAIRWVLGEQSAKTLRGAKMEDVIFSGSVDRKPVGMAKVTMTLDNSLRIFAVDSDEVEISRTLYRSGESNYMLNKNTCRLKDIQELFMDTGLGKDGFSVIGQGKIEEILTLHAEERRGLIEEAAGISKYKYRKREAERKLASTNDDMTRLDDILYELEQRIDPLAKQAEKVRVYRELKEELDTIQLAYLTKQVLGEQEKRDEQQKALETAYQAAVQAQTELDGQEASLSEKKQILARERHAVDDAQSAYTDSLRAAQEHEKTLSLLSERYQHNGERLETLKTATENNVQALTTAEQQVELLASALDENRAQAEAMNAKAETGKKALLDVETRVATLKEHIETLQSDQYELLSQQAATNNDMTRLEQALHGDAARSERLTLRVQELQERETALSEDITRLETEQSEKQQSVSETTTALSELADKVAMQQRSVAGARKQQQETVQLLMQSQSRLETLEEFEASGEGYYQGVQAVLRAKKEQQLQGIHGSILQLLDIPTAYLTAIENALGGAAQNIVVGNDREAQQAINWLKKERRGRVTFMPLNIVKGTRQEIDFNDEAVIGSALDLVQYDSKYEPVMAQLLGRVWVLRDLASATALAKRTGAKHRFVTLDGDVISPGGSMTGGHQKKKSSIVYRKHEMGTLKEKIKVLRNDVVQKERAVKDAESQLEAMQQAQERGRDRLQEQQLQLRALSVELEQLASQDKRLKRELELEEMNHQALSAQRETAQHDLTQAKEKATLLAEQLEKIRAALEDERVALQQNEIAQQRQQTVVQDILVRQATVDEQVQHQTQRHTDALATKNRLQEERARQQTETQKLEGERTQLAQALEKEKLALQEAQSNHAEMDGVMQEAKQRIDAMEVAIREQEQTLLGTRKYNEQCWREHNACEMRLARCDERVTQLTEQLLETFDLSPEAAVSQADFELDLSGASARIKTLRGKIGQLGEINFTALEEYERVSEQAGFLQAQLEDLNLAKEKLEAVIHEMETTMSQRFKEAYEKVNEKFSEIFTAMFGGGSARLELSLPGKYLETGVEIVAQPPGKKERVLTLLSGGERALTAAALLFALLEVRPSPFVILDEIEAALDEANVERFASFIKQYTNKTQFIIISHRKGTMEAAAVLYGITMDANGVSKQVSVRLSDFNDGQEVDL